MVWFTLALFLVVGVKLGLLAFPMYWVFVGAGIFIVDLARHLAGD